SLINRGSSVNVSVSPLTVVVPRPVHSSVANPPASEFGWACREDVGCAGEIVPPELGRLDCGTVLPWTVEAKRRTLGASVLDIKSCGEVPAAKSGKPRTWPSSWRTTVSKSMWPNAGLPDLDSTSVDAVDCPNSRSSAGDESMNQPYPAASAS